MYFVNIYIKVFLFCLYYIFTENWLTNVSCIVDSHCTDTQNCIDGECTDPCTTGDKCGVNADCTVQAHNVICECKDGLSGDPLVFCSNTTDFYDLRTTHKSILELTTYSALFNETITENPENITDIQGRRVKTNTTYPLYLETTEKYNITSEAKPPIVTQLI